MINESDSKKLLRPIIEKVCRNQQVPQDMKARLIADGFKLFSIFTDGSVMPTGRYKTVEQFVEREKFNNPQGSSPAKTTKDLLLEKLASHANAGNVRRYVFLSRRSQVRIQPGVPLISSTYQFLLIGAFFANHLAPT